MADGKSAVIIGAGLSGLACARELSRAGIRAQILEAGDGVGGRVRTDPFQGFRLDRGLQNILESYPEAKRVLDFAKLELKPFKRALLVRYRGRFHRLAAPGDEFFTALKSAFGPIGSLGDKLRAARLPGVCQAGTVQSQVESEDISVGDLLRSEFGIGATIRDRLFRPFLRSVTSAPDLSTSARFFRFIYRCFTTGEACLPTKGMSAIPEQLAAALSQNSIRLNAPVERIEGKSVILKTGERIEADAVVIATEGPEAARLSGGLISNPGYFATTTVYFAAAESPVREGILMLDGENRGPATCVAVPSDVSEFYAPPGQALIAVSALGTATEAEVRPQMIEWFGEIAKAWRHLKTYTIREALPDQSVGKLEPWQRPVTVRPGLFVCGDHRDNGSIDGALTSGFRAAKAILEAR